MMPRSLLSCEWVLYGAPAVTAGFTKTVRYSAQFWLLGKRQGDVGHRLENAVYLEFLRRYRRVDVGALGKGEVDFVAQDDTGVHYFQVALSVLDESTLSREMTPLKSIPDNRPKTLLTLDRVGTGDYDGIEHANVIDWLLDG